MFYTLSFAILLLIFTFGRSDVVVREKTVTFDRMDNGISWPLPDYNNPGVLLVHGRHCYDVLVETANKTGEMNKLHQAHCRDLLTRILRFLDSDQSHRVNDWICQILTGQKPKSSKLLSLLSPDNGVDYGIRYADATGKPKHQNLLVPNNGLDFGIFYASTQKPASNLLAPENGIDYGIRYADASGKAKGQNLLVPNNGLDHGISYADATGKSKSQNLLAPSNGLDHGISYADATGKAKDQNLLVPSNGLDHGISYASTKKLANLLAPKNGVDYGIRYANTKFHFTKWIDIGTVKNEPEDDTFVRLQADNFGELLMRNWTTPELVSNAERVYLKQWQSDTVAGVGAVGLYCHLGGHLDALRKVLA